MVRLQLVSPVEVEAVRLPLIRAFLASVRLPLVRSSQVRSEVAKLLVYVEVAEESLPVVTLRWLYFCRL